MKKKAPKKPWLVVVNGPYGEQKFNVNAVSQRYAEKQAERLYRDANNHSGRMKAEYLCYLPIQEKSKCA